MANYICVLHSSAAEQENGKPKKAKKLHEVSENKRPKEKETIKVGNQNYRILKLVYPILMRNGEKVYRLAVTPV